MKTLGLDLGTKRIGVAISDGLGITAQGLSTLEREKGDLIERLRDIVTKESVSEIVVGLPINMDGTSGPKAKEATAFADDLGKALKVPVKLWDERLSTLEAERVMIAGGASRSKRKQKLDKLAAQLILQSYLNADTRKSNADGRGFSSA